MFFLVCFQLLSSGPGLLRKTYIARTNFWLNLGKTFEEKDRKQKREKKIKKNEKEMRKLF